MTGGLAKEEVKQTRGWVAELVAVRFRSIRTSHHSKHGPGASSSGSGNRGTHDEGGPPRAVCLATLGCAAGPGGGRLDARVGQARLTAHGSLHLVLPTLPGSRATHCPTFAKLAFGTEGRTNLAVGPGSFAGGPTAPSMYLCLLRCAASLTSLGLWTEGGTDELIAHYYLRVAVFVTSR